MYKIVFEEKLRKKFRRIDLSVMKRVIQYLEQDVLLKNPKSLGKTLIWDRKGCWRYRVGNYRIICKIKDKELVILVIDVGHRKGIYQ